MVGLKFTKACKKRAVVALIAVLLFCALDGCSRKPETAPPQTKKIPELAQGKIVVDGKWEDWGGVVALLISASHRTALDVATAARAGDDLYLLLKAGRMTHTYIYLDSDASKSTGANSLDVWERVWGKQDALIGHGKRRVKFGHGWDYVIEITPVQGLSYKGQPLVSYRVKEIKKIVFDKFRRETLVGKPRNNKDDPSFLAVRGDYREIRVPLKLLGMKPATEAVFLFVDSSKDAYYHTSCHLVKAKITVRQEPRADRESAELKEERAKADLTKETMQETRREANIVQASQHAKESYPEAQQRMEAGNEEYEKQDYAAAVRLYEEASDYYRKSIEEAQKARETHLKLQISKVQESLDSVESRVREVRNTLQPLKGPQFNDRVVLKSGKEFECKIISETSDSVRIHIDTGIVRILKRQIASMTRGTPEKKENVFVLQPEIEELGRQTNELKSLIRECQSLSIMNSILSTRHLHSQIAKVQDSIASLDHKLHTLRSLLQPSRFPDKVLLKSGKEIECKIISVTPNSVRIRTDRGIVEIPEPQIESKTSVTPEDKENVSRLQSEVEEIDRQINELTSLIRGIATPTQ